jgi:hypothetical protein
MRRRAFRSATLLAGVLGSGGVAACAQILGLDDDLRPLEDASVVTGGSVLDGRVPDATTDGADAGDGGVTPGDAGNDGSTKEAGTGPWHIDTTFGNGLGYRELTGRSMETSASPSGVALLQHPTAGVLVIAATAANQLLVYRVEQPDSPLQTITLDDEEKYSGAVVSPDGGLYVLTDESNTDFIFRTLAPAPSFASDLGQPFTVATMATVGNIVGLSPTGVTAVGNTGPYGMYSAAQLDMSDRATPAILPWLTSQPATMLKTELTFDGGTFYGGIYDQGSNDVHAVWAMTGVGNGVVTGNVPGPVADGSGFTDLFTLDGQVFAVGFSDANFIFSPIPPPVDEPGPFATLPVPDGDVFYDDSARNPGIDSQLNGQVDPLKRILVGGYFGGVNLGNFLVDGGSDPQAFCEPFRVDGGVVCSSTFDLSEYLRTDAVPDWEFHSMLLTDPYLYVTAADMDGAGRLVVFRLVQGTP